MLQEHLLHHWADLRSVHVRLSILLRSRIRIAQLMLVRERGLFKSHPLLRWLAWLRADLVSASHVHVQLHDKYLRGDLYEHLPDWCCPYPSVLHMPITLYEHQRVRLLQPLSRLRVRIAAAAADGLYEHLRVRLLQPVSRLRVRVAAAAADADRLWYMPPTKEVCWDNLHVNS